MKATGGDTRLGGEDFDNKLVDWAVSEFEKQHGSGKASKLRANSRAIRRLRTACENAKRAVSSAPTTTLEVKARSFEACQSRVSAVVWVRCALLVSFRRSWSNGSSRSDLGGVTSCDAGKAWCDDRGLNGFPSRLPRRSRSPQVESLLDDADLSVELSREKFESLNDQLFTRCARVPSLQGSGIVPSIVSPAAWKEVCPIVAMTMRKYDDAVVLASDADHRSSSCIPTLFSMVLRFPRMSEQWEDWSPGVSPPFIPPPPSSLSYPSLSLCVLGRCINTVTAVLKDASLSISDVTDVVLVGGSTRVPALQERLKALFGGRIELCRSINPDEVGARERWRRIVLRLQRTGAWTWVGSASTDLVDMPCFYRWLAHVELLVAGPSTRSTSLLLCCPLALPAWLPGDS